MTPSFSAYFFQSVTKAGTGSRGKGTPLLEGGRVIAVVSITVDVCLHRSLHRQMTEKKVLVCSDVKKIMVKPKFRAD